jgi:hypothetical protein
MSRRGSEAANRHRRDTGSALRLLAPRGVGAAVGGVLAVLSALRVFRDRDGECEEDLMRTGTTWVNRMRERLDADFHFRVTSQATGAGGARRTLVRAPWADSRQQAPQTNYRYLSGRRVPRVRPRSHIRGAR